MNADRRMLERLLLLFALALPLSISAAEAFFAAALVVWIIDGTRGKPLGLRGNPLLGPAAVFLGLAAATVFWSVRPDVTLHRLHRLAFPLLIPIMDATWGRGSRDPGESSRLFLPVCAYLVGCVALSLTDLVRVPREVAAGADLLLTGNMRDPQMYLAGLCLLAAITLPAGRRPWRPFYLPAIGFISLGVVLHFKRGVWIGLVCALALLGWRAGRRRLLLLLGLAVVAALALPGVRERWLQAFDLGQESVGGRTALWKHAAPALLSAFPQGMGWSAVAHEDLARHTPFLQDDLNHLHNNLLQVAVETGWLGLAAWLGWMVAAWRVMWRLGRGPPDPTGTPLGLGIWAAFAGLMLNGLFEYNFGDTEVLLLLCYLMGLSAALHRRAAESASLVDQGSGGGSRSVEPSAIWVRSQSSNASRSTASPSS